MFQINKVFQVSFLFFVLIFSFGCENGIYEEELIQIEDLQEKQSDQILEEIISEEALPANEEVFSENNTIEILETIEKNLETLPEKKVTSSEKLSFKEGMFFPECKSRWQFKSAFWYESFRDKVTDLQGISEKNIAMICESNDQEIILAMLNGNIQETGGVVRYRVKADVLEKASVTKDVSLHLHKFKGRFNNLIPMIGGLQEKKSGCIHSFRLNYDFLVNEIKPLSKCSICNKESETCEFF